MGNSWNKDFTVDDHSFSNTKYNNYNHFLFIYESVTKLFPQQVSTSVYAMCILELITFQYKISCNMHITRTLY